MNWNLLFARLYSKSKKAIYLLRTEKVTGVFGLLQAGSKINRIADFIYRIHFIGVHFYSIQT